MSNGSQKILVTGGAGFIGSSFVRVALAADYQVIILDALTYAGHIENLEEVLKPGLCDFEKGSITNLEFVSSVLKKHQPDYFVNFAAESHVDNSISGPKAFMETNILGTFSCLEACRAYYNSLTSDKKNSFKYIQISTDEVFGSLNDTGKFNESSAYQPNSPYSSSKASGDHLARAWFHTYKLPTIITNCSNNYGPRQYPEKLIPLMIQNALIEKTLPVYGTGKNIRDWIHVDDHTRGVLLALQKGKPGSTYCFGGNSEMTNLEVVNSICSYLDEIKPRKSGQKYSELITFVDDRAGHDWRYAIDDSLAQKELDFKRQFESFNMGLKSTCKWYLENKIWSEKIQSKMRST
ncbi:MAG: dTDP-glucose 4,6-dehydratase [Bdellovibrionota bacterium]